MPPSTRTVRVADSLRVVRFKVWVPVTVTTSEPNCRRKLMASRKPFDGAPGTTAGSFASYWNVVAFHVYVVPNTTPGGKIEAAMAPLGGTSAARSAVAASRLSASERARRVTSVGWAARSSGRRAAIGLAAVGTYVVANEKLWNGREVKLVPSAWTLAAVASGSAGFFGWSGLSPQAAASSAAATAMYRRRER